MRPHHRRSPAVLLLYCIQVVIIGRALSVGTGTYPDVYSLCNNTWVNKTRVNEKCLFNSTSSHRNTASFWETWLFNSTLSLNDTKPGLSLLNMTALPYTVYEFQWEDGLFLGLLGISSLLGTVGNVAVILAFLLYHKVRTTANTFILNLSIWDLVSSAAIIPLSILSMATGQPNCGEACCAFIGFLSMFTTYKRLFSPVKAFLWVVGSWVTGTMIMFPAISGIYGSLGWDAYISVCQVSSDDPQSPLFFKNVLLSMYWVVVFTISAFYIRIYLHVRKSTMAIGQHLGHSPQQVSLQAVKRTKHMFYIFFTFFALTCPSIVMNYVDFFSAFLPKAVFLTSSALYYLNIAVNPIIYTWTLKEFQQGFKSMIRCRRHLALVPPAAQPTAQRSTRVINVLSRLTVSNRVAQAGPSVAVPEAKSRESIL
ncbi:PREDICTED: adenosine receptor A1-like [Branchiostoma belcheri]|uniref:Adenosine receptor A1-like n=1 Tax=Branchiostoma belcheri TaxID=7741 RepID=A0A6P4Z1R9_BRABE|nr:PREDICTED: adenosine receptor A1-like [Branchiostoma belcheri]